MDNCEARYNSFMVMMEKFLRKCVDVSYKCNQCDYSSSLKSNVNRHMKAHNAEKTNKCNQCNFASSQACILKMHWKKHSGEKSNKCNQCDYASFSAGDLTTFENTQCGKGE